MGKAAVKGSDGRGKSHSGRATMPAGDEAVPDMTVWAAPATIGSDEMPRDSVLGADMPADEIPVAAASAIEADASPTETVAPATAAVDTIQLPVTGTGEPTVTDRAANAVFATLTAEPEQPAPAPTDTGPNIPGPNSTGMEKVMKTTEEFFAFGQGNLEAIIKASQIWATGLQDLSKQMTAGAQANLDETMAAFKAMSSAKTLKDAIDMQTGFARSTFEKSMTETGKLTDASMKLAEQALAPITARVTTAMDGLVKAA